jgi:hypothetical protein
VTPALQQALEINLYVKKKDARLARDYLNRVMREYRNCEPTNGFGWVECLNKAASHTGCATSMVFNTWVSPKQIGRLKKQFEATGLFAKVLEMPEPACATWQDVTGACTESPTSP